MSISDGKLGMTTDGKRIFITIELMRVALLQFNQEHYLFCLKSVCQGINSSLNFSSKNTQVFRVPHTPSKKIQQLRYFQTFS
jgi:hypothetical protein